MGVERPGGGEGGHVTMSLSAINNLNTAATVSERRPPPLAVGRLKDGAEAGSACQQDKHDRPLSPHPPLPSSLPASDSRRPVACPLSVALLGRVCTVTSWSCSRPATWRLQQTVSTTDRHTRQRPSRAAVQQMDSNYAVLWGGGGGGCEMYGTARRGRNVLY